MCVKRITPHDFYVPENKVPTVSKLLPITVASKINFSWNNKSQNRLFKKVRFK
jgi:hypothetical protein